MTQKQALAWKHLNSLSDAAVLYGGAKGGAKTFLLCVWLQGWANHLIKLWNLKPSQNPLPIGFVGRKRGVDFRDTTLESFKRIFPPETYRLHDSEHEIIFNETVKVFCGGLDNQDRINKFNSAEFAFFAIDQAEETERTDGIDILQAALRLKVNNIQPPYKQLYTANPADCWLKEDFIDNPKPGNFFVPALYTDNPHLPTNYKDTLEAAFRYNDPLLRAYKDGDWLALQAENVLISGLMLERLKEANIHPKDVRRVVSCDPSLGGDECVIYALENGKVIEEKILHERDPMKIAGHMQVVAHRWLCDDYAIDTTGGLGEAIASRIREQQRNARVQSMSFAESASDDVHYANLRAELWWYTMTQIQDRLIPYPVDEELRRQLTAVRFKPVSSNGRIQLEPKDKTKKTLGRSPDRADAFVIGIYALQRVQPMKRTDAWVDASPTREVSATVRSAMAA